MEEQQNLYAQYVENVYQNLTELGGGRLGKTFLARNVQTGKIVIKKQVSWSAARVYERLKDVDCPHLPHIYEICPLIEGCIIVEEYISGETLEQVLARNGSLPLEKVLEYFEQILKGVGVLHEKGVVHRDLTPANILVSSDHVIKIIDFGIARNRNSEGKQDTYILGTVGYASPEQFGFLQTDGRADIYALGILLNKMLTGKMPNEELTDNPVLGQIVEKCTRIDPKQRYESTTEILREIGREHVIPKQWEKDASVLPGFRSNILWRKITAVIGYVCMGILTVEPLSRCGMNPVAWLLDGIAVFVYVWLPFLLLSNFGRWDRRLRPFRKMPKPVTVAIRILGSEIAFYYGVLLENYVRYVLLGLPRAS